jgi:hypothetical protein
MAMKNPRKSNADTSDYSATEAPENREHVESRNGTGDPSQAPGGPQGAPVEVGVSGLDRTKVRTKLGPPSKASRRNPSKP